MEQDAPFTFTLAAPSGAGPTLARAIGARRGPARAHPAASGLEGTERRLNLRDPTLSARLREGVTQDGTAERVCLMILSGPAPAVGAAALRLAEAGAAPPPPPPPVPPVLEPDQPAAAAFAALIGQLGDTIRHHAPGAIDGQAIEPVHQMRVAVRRLRSAIGLFRRVASGPEIAAAAEELKALMGLLGPARDWDVFLAGTGAAIAEAFPEDPTVAALLAEARGQREAAYTALAAHLQGADFRVLCTRLAWLAAARPWNTPDDAPDLVRLARRMLARRWARMEKTGPDLTGLPPAALHQLRLDGKRMRYASEFFQPVFPGRAARRWIKRLAALQDQLGMLNDTTVAADLMARLGPVGAGFAGGLVLGMVAASAAHARPRIARAWQRLLRLEPFWE